MKSSKRQHDTTRLFGFWVENHKVQLAIADPLDGGKYRITVESVACSRDGGWLKGGGLDEFDSVIESLVDRYEMHRGRVALSLDGDLCVSRVTLGTSDHVDSELAKLEDRIPRYLQLGPGEKVTGRFRERLEGQTEYAITSVANRSTIETIYNLLRKHEVEVVWAESSLVSVARFIGSDDSHENSKPLLLADGTGLRWDVGIVHTGRLILDYRPAAATTAEAFRAALDGHIPRLRRFCQRHLGIAGDELKQMLVCGTPERSRLAIETFASSDAIEPVEMRIHQNNGLYEIKSEDCDPHCIPAVSAVLPLMLDVEITTIPDLLSEVRRAPELSLLSKTAQLGWPALIAVLLLCFGHYSLKRQQKEVDLLRRANPVEAQVAATQTRMARLAVQRDFLNQFELIEQECSEPRWTRQLRMITKSLPETAKLNEFRVEKGSQIRIDGTVVDEMTIYEILEQLRRLPGVSQVALQSTNPEPHSTATRFVIQQTLESSPQSAKSPSSLAKED